MTRSYVGVSFRLTVENLRPFYPRCPCGRAASSRLRVANAALAARARSRRRRLGAARRLPRARRDPRRSEEHTSELQSRPHLVCRLLLEKKNRIGELPSSSNTKKKGN